MDPSILDLAPSPILHAFGGQQTSLARARKWFPDFVDLVGRDERGGHISLKEQHLSWAFHLAACWRKGKHALILAPFGSGKTSAFLVPLATFLIGRDVQTRVKVVCGGDTAATDRVASAKTLMESPSYQAVFPHVKKGDPWSRHEACVQRKGFAVDPSLQARGVESRGIGSRADYLLFDDVCDPRNCATGIQRDKIKSLVHGTWLSRLDPDRGRALWIATPWHIDDATHELMAREEWVTLKQPVNDDVTAFEQHVIGAWPGYETEVAAMWAAWTERDADVLDDGPALPV